MLGDDEMRFHIFSMMQSCENVAFQENPTIPGFAMLEPLLLEPGTRLVNDYVLHGATKIPASVS